MFILLPPSEGKADAPRRGRPLDLEAMSQPALTDTRRLLVSTLEALAQGPRGRAVTALGLTPGLASEVDKDAVLTTTPTMPAAALYSGVLFDALGLASLDTAARRRATRSILVSSALFGSVRLDDRIPPYRLSMAARLPRLGTLGSVWKPALTTSMPEVLGKRVVLDLRSGPYAAMWRPSRDMAPRVLTARVLHESVPGDRSSRAIVSHFNKATKGRLVRSLMLDARRPDTTDELIDLLRDRGWTVEAGPDTDGSRPRTIDIVVAEV